MCCDILLASSRCTFKRYRILYTILEYNPLLDSSNLSMEDWATIAKDISTHYQHFNGFVILHGTDTMSYTASALSFMFENLGKTVILTGSQVCGDMLHSVSFDIFCMQVPISELRNDARDNILGSLILAGQYVIPEVELSVCLCIVCDSPYLPTFLGLHLLPQ